MYVEEYLKIVANVLPNIISYSGGCNIYICLPIIVDNEKMKAIRKNSLLT